MQVALRQCFGEHPRQDGASKELASRQQGEKGAAGHSLCRSSAAGTPCVLELLGSRSGRNDAVRYPHGLAMPRPLYGALDTAVMAEAVLRDGHASTKSSHRVLCQQGQQQREGRTHAELSATPIALAKYELLLPVWRAWAHCLLIPSSSAVGHCTPLYTSSRMLNWGGGHHGEYALHH